MSAVWMRFRADLRARWAALLALTLLVGLAGGATLAAFAGARRTSSAFSRLVHHTEAWDVLVNPDAGSSSALRADAVARLPQVRRAGRVEGLAVAPARFHSPDELEQGIGVVLATDRRVGYDFARPRMDAGRMPRRDRPNEVWVDRLLASQQGLHVGSRFPLVAFTADDLAKLDSGAISFEEGVAAIRRGEFGVRIPARVVGIGQVPDGIVVDQGFADGTLLFGPALLRRHRDVAVPYWGEVVRLRHASADLASFRRSVQALVPDEPIAFQSEAKTATKSERAVRPAVGALSAFALVIALTGLLIVGQAIARQTVLDASDNDVLRALGSTRGALFSSAMLRAAVVAIVGAGIAVVVAVIVSPLTPIGIARDMEPTPGIAVDGTVLALGFVATAVVVLLLASIPSYRVARARAGGSLEARPSRAAALVADAGMSVPATTGVRMALEPGRGRTAVPVRTTIVSAGLAIATVVAAVVFASSLQHLVSTPRLFGWNWDRRLEVSPSEDQAVNETVHHDVARLLDKSPAVARWGTVSLSDLSVGGDSMPAIGVDTRRGAATPTLVSGRLPARADEIAFGHLTERELGVGPGDVVTARDVDGNAVRLHVVGTVVLPGLGTYPGSDKTSLGEGAVVTRDTLYRLGPNFQQDNFVVKFAPGASATARRSVTAKAARIANQAIPQSFSAAGVQRPSDIIAYDRVRSTPLVLALVLALLAFATVAHALVSAVRRRRRDLAMLATLGLTRHQVSSTVAWQATTVGVCALVIGLPLGIVGGRWAWGFLADDLGTVSEPRVPVLALLIGIPVVLLLCNGVAYVPGRIAARIRPAVVLRSE